MNEEAVGRTYDFTDQVVLITGGGRGLGRAFAQSLADAQANVIVTARSEDELKTTVQIIKEKGGTAICFQADVTDRSRMTSIVMEVERQFGHVDILINNAAVLTPLGFDWEVDAEEWWRTFEINVRGPFICTQAVLPGMMARRKGKIINITSVAAHTVHPYGTAYCASKAALSHMTHLFAESAREYDISVFALSPGGPTAMVEILATSPIVSQELSESARATLRDGSGVKESVEMLMFLLSGKADALTGRHISFWDSKDELLRRSDEIITNDLYTLGLRV
jgi:NAD(P)-dependent dehydrogenase (short-subunit alcohol dehydrogenase family)